MNLEATIPPSFRANITTRYGSLERDTYRRVMLLAEKTGLSVSRAQLMLVRRGLRRLGRKHKVE